MKYLLEIDGSAFKIFDGELTRQEIKALEDDYINIHEIEDFRTVDRAEIDSWLNRTAL